MDVNTTHSADVEKKTLPGVTKPLQWTKIGRPKMTYKIHHFAL